MYPHLSRPWSHPAAGVIQVVLLPKCIPQHIHSTPAQYSITQYAPPLCSKKASPTSQGCKRTPYQETFLLCRSQVPRPARLDCTAIPTAATTIIPTRSMISGKGILGSNIGSLPQLFPGGVAAIRMRVLEECEVRYGYA
jgi:hypothetical protein